MRPCPASPRCRCSPGRRGQQQGGAVPRPVRGLAGDLHKPSGRLGLLARALAGLGQHPVQQRPSRPGTTSPRALPQGPPTSSPRRRRRSGRCRSRSTRRARNPSPYPSSDADRATIRVLKAAMTNGPVKWPVVGIALTGDAFASFASTAAAPTHQELDEPDAVHRIRRDLAVRPGRPRRGPTGRRRCGAWWGLP